MSNDLFAAALGITSPWYTRDVAFDAAKRLPTIGIDFPKGVRFAYPGVEGLHPVHDTQTKRYRHLNFFQHECYLEVRTLRITMPDARVFNGDLGFVAAIDLDRSFHLNVTSTPLIRNAIFQRSRPLTGHKAAAVRGARRLSPARRWGAPAWRMSPSPSSGGQRR